MAINESERRELMAAILQVEMAMNQFSRDTMGGSRTNSMFTHVYRLLETTTKEKMAIIDAALSLKVSVVRFVEFDSLLTKSILRLFRTRSDKQIMIVCERVSRKMSAASADLSSLRSCANQVEIFDDLPPR
jgi:hypothetical protein